MVGAGDYMKAPGTLFTQVCLESKDLDSWVERKEPFIRSDRPLAICPNTFRFGRWYYYICGSGVWRSRDRFGPWVEHQPLRLDNLAVPKTARFGKDRRIYAGFLSDGGWGGNSVLRELVQDSEGRLGTRFVPELIPACGDSLPVIGSIKLEATGGRRYCELPDIPNDFRLQMDVVPQAGASLFGAELRADNREAGCELVFDARRQQARFTRMHWCCHHFELIESDRRDDPRRRPTAKDYS